MSTSLTSPATRKQIRRVADLTEVALRDSCTQQQLQTVHANGGAYKDDYLVFLRQFIQRFGQSFSVVVDYSQTLAEMIQAGKYDWVNSDITADHFPVKGEGRQPVEVVLFHFNRTVSSETAIAEMDKAGFRPATPSELLALGAARPDLQRQFPIVALGQFWQDPDGYRRVVALYSDSAGRCLGLDWFGHDWLESYRFAAVSK